MERLEWCIYTSKGEVGAFSPAPTALTQANDDGLRTQRGLFNIYQTQANVLNL